MRNDLAKFMVCAVLGSAFLTGCRFKGGESFLSATTPNPPASNAWKGDPYASAGLAEASGGQVTATRYGLGAKKNTTAPVDPGFDQPAKGTGMQPGENPVAAYPGFGNSNGPSMQPSPRDVNSTTVRTGI